MRKTIAILTVVAAIGASACTKESSNGPSNSTTTTSVATTTSTTTVATTTTTAQATFTVSGRVFSEKTNELLKFADIEIIQGANIGRRFQGDGNGGYSMTGLQAGAFVMRVWAPGYLVKDVLVTITTSNQTIDVQLTPIPPSTTTVTALNADFSAAPSPCTIDQGLVINCTLDAGMSTGTIVTYKWSYGGKDVFNEVVHKVSGLGCNAFQGSGNIVTASIRLTVFDDVGGASSVDKGVAFQKLNGVCP